jgi:hypothetical protein
VHECSTNLVRGGLPRGVIEVTDNDLRAFISEASRTCQSDSTAATGDDSYAIL